MVSRLPIPRCQLGYQPLYLADFYIVHRHGQWAMRVHIMCVEHVSPLHLSQQTYLVSRMTCRRRLRQQIQRFQHLCVAKTLYIRLGHRALRFRQ